LNYSRQHFVYHLLILSLSLVLFLPFIGSLHLFDWDEINFAEAAREMIVSGNYQTVQINFEPFWEKPPLFIWMQVLSMKVFGINEFAARFPNVLCGFFTLLIIFEIGKKLKDVKFGLLWVLVWIGSILPHLYFKSGIIDPWFNLFIFSSIYFVFNWLNSNNKQIIYALLSGFSIGLAILTKGPVAFVLFSLSVSVYFILSKFYYKTIVFKNLNFSSIFLFILITSITGGFWFLIQIFSGNFELIQQFIDYQIRLASTQDSGHGGFLGYHVVVLLLGVFPSSIFFIYGYNMNKDWSDELKIFSRWMKILFWIVLIIFSVVKTKIVHYSSLCYFPMTFLAATKLYELIVNECEVKKSMKILFAVIGSILGVLVLIITQIDYFKVWLLNPEIVKDQFAIDQLKNHVEWVGIEFLIGVFITTGIFVSIYYMKPKFNNKGNIFLFATTTIFIFATIVGISPKIEAYSQRKNIEFFKSLQGKPCIMGTLGYKSYAPYFYGNQLPQLNVNQKDIVNVLNTQNLLPIYLSIKTKDTTNFKKKYKYLQHLYSGGGFSFFVQNK